MWTQENRPRYDRSKLRYPSDVTDEEWAVIGPLIPPAKPGGNRRTVDVRAVVDGVMCILSTGCQWAALPKDLPPRSTVNDYLRRWDEDRTLDRIHHALYVLCRELAGRAAGPTAAIIDSQSVKGAEKGDAASTRRASMPARRFKGKKRHVLVDTQGMPMQAIIHAADIQDRDGGVLLMGALFGLYPFLLKLHAGSGYQGPTFQAGLHAVCGRIGLEIVKRSDRHKFVVLPKRWIVERTIAWLNRCRRLAKDWECLNRTGLAFLRWASVRLMLRRICRTTT